MSANRRRACKPTMDRLDERCLLSGLSPVQMSQAYGVNSFHFVNSSGQSIKADGAGETIAIVVGYHDPYLANDLTTFDRTYGLPNPSLTQWHYGTASNDGWATEETLDVEWSHAIAPGAKLIVVEAATSSLSDLMTAVNFARNQPGVVAVSMSWVVPEYAGESSYDSTFTTPAGHPGITFLAASGDQGAWPGVSYPAASPNVVSVGGTTLYVDNAGNYLGETGWSGGTTASGGGGYSHYEYEPAYQTGVQNSGVRTVPDVSMDADPNTGCMVYTTAPSTGRATFQPIGGTSAATPMWAGIIALADEGRAIIGKSSLYGGSQTLPALYSATMRSDFHDITSGFNGYHAGVGYDLDTGLGTPRVFNVVRDLMQVGSAATPSVQSGSGQTSMLTSKTPSAIPTLIVPKDVFDLALESVSPSLLTKGKHSW
jgi:subtilase family serine protease